MSSLSVRPATALDLSALWSWREASPVFAVLRRQKDDVSFARFSSWFHNARKDNDGLFLIAVWKTLRIGAICFKHTGGGVYRLSLTLRPPFFARGLSRDMLIAGLSYLQRERRVASVEASVPAINPATASLFRQAGFSVLPTGNELACVFRPGTNS